MSRLKLLVEKTPIFTLTLLIGLSGLVASTSRTDSAIQHPTWRKGCDSELAHPWFLEEKMKDERLVGAQSSDSRPYINVSYSCLMKAIAEPTPRMLNEMIATVQKNPGAKSRDFHTLEVIGGSLHATFWPRSCVESKELQRHEWAAIFMDRFRVPGPPRMRTAAAFTPPIDFVGKCPHQLQITPAVAPDAQILSGRGLSEYDLRELFRKMITDPNLNSLPRHVEQKARLADKYKLAWQIGDESRYVVTFDSEGPCIPIGFWGGVTPVNYNEKYSQISAHMVPRPDDSRCISSVSTRWNAK